MLSDVQVRFWLFHAKTTWVPTRALWQRWRKLIYLLWRLLSRNIAARNDFVTAWCVGFFCPENTSFSAMQPCPAGRYGAVPGLSVCSLCAAGKWGNQLGFTSSTQCSDCQQGFYCNNSGSTTGLFVCVHLPLDLSAFRDTVSMSSRYSVFRSCYRCCRSLRRCYWLIRVLVVSCWQMGQPTRFHIGSTMQRLPTGLLL